MSKQVIMTLALVINSISAFSMEYENPYVNKHIESHSKEFLAWEVITDFNKTIELYNKDPKNKIKIIKSSKGYHRLVDGKDKIEFDITLVTSGQFYFNGFLTNLKDQKVVSSPSLLSSFIGVAYAAGPAPVSKVLLAALLSVDEKFKEISFLDILPSQKEEKIKLNWKAVKSRITKYQKQCEDISENVQAYSARSKIEGLFDVMKKQKGDEADVIENAFEVVGVDCVNQYERQRTGIGQSLYGKTDSFKDEALSVCVSLQELKSCLVTIPSYHVSDSYRTTIKESIRTRDDLKKYDADTSAR